MACRRFARCRDHILVPAHAKVIIRAPDHDILDAIGVPAPERMRKGTSIALDIGEDPIAALALQL
jgi:hypothetical protein